MYTVVYMIIYSLCCGRGSRTIFESIRIGIRTTLEFLYTWEEMYNPDFKVFDSEHFKIWIINIYSKHFRMGRTDKCNWPLCKERSLWWNLCAQRYCL